MTDSIPAGDLACNVDDIPVSGAVRVMIGDIPVAVVKDSDGQVHAIGDTCSHAEVSLSEGDVEGCAIECWGHGSQFDLRSGEPLSPPAFEPVPVFAFEIVESNVYVDVTTIVNGADVPQF